MPFNLTHSSEAVIEESSLSDAVAHMSCCICYINNTHFINTFIIDFDRVMLISSGQTFSPLSAKDPHQVSTPPEMSLESVIYRLQIQIFHQPSYPGLSLWDSCVWPC